MANEQVLSQIAEVANFVRDKAAADEVARKAGEDRSNEQKAMIDKLSATMTELLEQNKKSNRPYTDAPLSKEDQEMVERGLFNGRMSAPYQRMLAISPQHDLIRGTDQAADLQRAHDLHDATTWRFHCLKARYDMTVAIDRLSRHPDTIMWARELRRHGYINDVAEFLNPKSGKLMEVAMARNNEVLSPANTTQGMDDLTFTLTSAQLIDQVYVDLIVASNVTRIPLSRASTKFPRLTGLTQGVWGGGAAAGELIPAQGNTNQLPSAIDFMPDDSFFQKPTIASLQFDVEHILSYLLFNDDMLEDSIIPWLPFMRSELSKNMARAIDVGIYMGDNSATNMDGYTGNNIARAFYGLRYMCGAQPNGWIHATVPTYTSGNMVNANGAISLAVLETAIKQMGKYALRPDQCVIALRVSDYLKVMMLDQFKLWTNAGSSMTLRNGVVGSLYGIDIVPFDVCPLLNEYGCLNAGPGLPGTEDKSSAMIWRRDMCLWGMFDTVQVESTRWAPRLITIMQSDVRGDFQTVIGQTSDNTSGWPYVNIVNITV